MSPTPKRRRTRHRRPSEANAARYAALSPNQIITSRGYWQGSPDGAAQPLAQSALKNALHSPGLVVASADPNTTGSISPLPGATPDRVPADSRSAMPNSPTASRRLIAAAIAAAAAQTAAAEPGQLIAQNGMTIVAKGVIDQPQSSFQRAIRLASAAVKVGERFDDPWLRAIVLSPSVNHFLTTLAFGARDFTSLAEQMVKPASSVMMTFSIDPSMGLSSDHFSGSAIVFLSTITYPTRTASLQ